jgi:hypothetical protein
MVALYVVTGRLSNGRLVELDEAVPLGDAKVRVSIEPITATDKHPVHEVIAEIRKEQQECGHVPPTREEVDRYLADERATWDR